MRGLFSTNFSRFLTLFTYIRYSFTTTMSLSEECNQRPFTICIEGNIGSGKTTFLKHFKVFKDIAVLQEPVELWRNVSGTNLLDLMYSDSERWACLFQSYVQLTMLQLHMLETNEPIKVMERSVYSARCFIENMKRTGLLHTAEYTLLDDWYTWCIDDAHTKADLIVYLRTTPDVVYERMRSRNRKEESNVSFEYIKQMHSIHEEWLCDGTLFNTPTQVIIVDANQDLEKMIVEFKKISRIIFNSYVEERTKAIGYESTPVEDTTFENL